jgi:hypothetical protein
MVCKGQTIRRMLCITLLAAAFAPFAGGGESPAKQAASSAAPLELPRTLDLLLGEQARKRRRAPGIIEGSDFLFLKPGLAPVVWPRNTDMRARIVTTEVRNTPVVGWIAENLYRSKSDNGWCLEVDPGDGQYVVFYRFHPKK